MRTVNDLLQAAKKINLLKIYQDAYAQNVDQFLVLQKKQLYDGKLSTGGDLKPSYFNDPYFKTPEAAARYSEWKDKITPNGKRSSGTPNLYINGYWYSKMFIRIKSEGYLIDDSADSTASIVEKYGDEIFGLDKDYRVEFIQIIYPIAMDSLVSQLNGSSVKSKLTVA